MTNPTDPLELHSGDYVSGYERHSMARVTRLAARMQLSGREELADFACGNGMLLQATHDRVRHYHGVDFSADFIRAARRRADARGIGNATFHCEDIVSFCGRHPARFDVAAALDFSEHVDDATFIEVFSAIRGSLRTGGRLYLHTPNLDFFLEQLKQRGILRQFPQHIAVRNRAQLVALLEACGFRKNDVAAEFVPHYNALKLLHPLHGLPGTGSALAARIFVRCVK